MICPFLYPIYFPFFYRSRYSPFIFTEAAGHSEGMKINLKQAHLIGRTGLIVSPPLDGKRGFQIAVPILLVYRKERETAEER